MLEEVVETAKRAFDKTTHGHLVLPTLTIRLEGDSVDVVRDEAAMGASSIAETLLDHTAEHSSQAVGVLVGMLLHGLDRSGYAHLTTCDIDDRIDEIQVGKLAIGSIIDDVNRLEASFLGVVDCNSTLQSTRLEG